MMAIAAALVHAALRDAAREATSAADDAGLNNTRAGNGARPEATTATGCNGHAATSKAATTARCNGTTATASKATATADCATATAAASTAAASACRFIAEALGRARADHRQKQRHRCGGTQNF
jgi:hypothetical protein